jgi:hypothetical protein
MTALLSLRDSVKAALVAEQEHRGQHDDWIERERRAMCDGAQAWRDQHGGIGRRVTPEDVERFEHRALGHSDYTPKIALYVAEFVLEVPR